MRRGSTVDLDLLCAHQRATDLSSELFQSQPVIYTQVKTVPVLASDRFWRVAAALLAFVTVAAMYTRFVAHARHVDDRASP